MSRDDTKLNYYSGWDIDQLVDSPTTAVTSGTTAIYTIPTTSVAIPVSEVQFQPGGSSMWYQSGTYSTNGTIAGFQSFSTYVSGNQIFITTSTNGLARCFVWSDKVDY